jgi:predicted secreted protein
MFVGRALVFEYPTGTTIASVRTKSFTVDSSAIDVTTDDDSGIRTLLEAPGQHQIDLSVEGLLANDSLLEQIVDGTLFIQNLTITFPFAGGTPATIVGDFRLNNFEVSGEYQDAITFSATLQSSGTFTFTAAV